MIDSLPQSLEDDFFPSLLSLQAAHSSLMKQYREQGSTSEALAQIERLMRKVQATGALLDSEDDRWAAQSILDYWDSLLYREEQKSLDMTLVKFDPSLAPELDDSLCPYVGLEAFQEDNQHLFFGRQRLLKQLLEKLETDNLLAVVGSSGSGKSSVVLGGLIPRLKAGELQGSENWHFYQPMVPGSNPLEALACIVNSQYIDTHEWKAQQDTNFKADPGHLAKIVCSEYPQTSTVLVVDQFEELFTLCQDNEVRQAFVDNLLNLTQLPDTRHIVILTMRTDFEDRLTRVKGFQKLFEEAQVRVIALDASELRDAIEKPSELRGLKFEDGLIDELIEDVLGEPAALPLLQFTLLKLWENRERNRITWEKYKEVGGGRNSLAMSANGFYASLIPEDQQTVKQILLRMVRPTEGLEVTSNRVLRRDLYHLGDASDRIDRVLNKLIEARLVRYIPGHSPQDTQVEITHEALIRNWDRLIEWLENKRQFLRQRRRFSDDVERWLLRDKNKDFLYRGEQTEEAQRYGDLTPLETEFIRQSLEEENTQRQERLELQRDADDYRDIAYTAAVEAYDVLSDDSITEVSKLLTTDQDQIDHADNYVKNGLKAEDLRLILRELQSFQAHNNSEKPKQSNPIDSERPLVLEVSPETITQINTHLAAIEKLKEAGQLSDTQQLNFNQIKEKVYSFKDVNQEFKSLADNIIQVLQDAIESLKYNLKELEFSLDDTLLEVRSQMNRQEQIDLINLLTEFQIQLGEGRIVSRWLNRERSQQLAERLSQHALGVHPHIRETISPKQLEAFRFSIGQILEQISHCLIWGRTNIFDSPENLIVLEGDTYITAFEYLKQLIPEHLPENGRKNLQNYIDYLVEKIPTYRYVRIN